MKDVKSRRIAWIKYSTDGAIFLLICRGESVKHLCFTCTDVVFIIGFAGHGENDERRQFYVSALMTVVTSTSSLLKALPTETTKHECRSGEDTDAQSSQAEFEKKPASIAVTARRRASSRRCAWSSCGVAWKLFRACCLPGLIQPLRASVNQGLAVRARWYLFSMAAPE